MGVENSKCGCGDTQHQNETPIDSPEDLLAARKGRSIEIEQYKSTMDSPTNQKGDKAFDFSPEASKSRIVLSSRVTETV